MFHLPDPDDIDLDSCLVPEPHALNIPQPRILKLQPCPPYDRIPNRRLTQDSGTCLLGSSRKASRHDAPVASFHGRLRTSHSPCSTWWSLPGRVPILQSLRQIPECPCHWCIAAVWKKPTTLLWHVYIGICRSCMSGLVRCRSMASQCDGVVPSSGLGLMPCIVIDSKFRVQMQHDTMKRYFLELLTSSRPRTQTAF